jgi:hypothetical protein
VQSSKQYIRQPGTDESPCLNLTIVNVHYNVCRFASDLIDYPDEPVANYQYLKNAKLLGLFLNWQSVQNDAHQEKLVTDESPCLI